MRAERGQVKVRTDGEGQASAGPGRSGGRRWPVRVGVVPPLAEGFVTRPETAPGLAAALAGGSVVALVSGLAGTRPPSRVQASGKTQLAVWCAESLWWSREVDLLAWVPAGSRASILAGYVEAAVAVGIDPAGTAEEVAARFAGWLGQAARPWLVALDGLRDPADLEGLWPSGADGRVVITGPEENAVAGRSGVRVLPVGVFSAREAMRYLMGRLSADPDQRHGAVGLAAELGCQPLALAQASAVIATSMASCEDYQDQFTRRRAQLAGPGDGEPPVVGEVTWRLSAEHTERLSPGRAVQPLLALAALLGETIPGTVFTAPAACDYLAAAGAPAAADPEHAWDGMLTLERTGLVTIGTASAPPTVWMSPVLAAQLRAATRDELSGQAVNTAAAALLEAWPEEPEPWLAGCLRSCAASLQRAGGERLWASGAPHPLLLRAGRSMDRARLTGPAVAYWSELATTSEKLLGSVNAGTLTIGSHLIQTLLTAGHAAEAVEWSRWVVTSKAHTLGPTHADSLADRIILGRALIAAGQPHHAVTVLAEAAAGYERIRGTGHPDTLGARDELAAAYQAAGNTAGAVDCYWHALTERDRNQGPGHPDTMSARDRLAHACLEDGRFKEAISHFNQALTDRQRVLGADHRDTIAARAQLAAAYRTAGKIAAALQLSEQVCADYERVLGAGHRDTLAHRANLAHAYQAAGRLTDAAALLRDTLSACQQGLPPGDPLIQALRKSITGISGDSQRRGQAPVGALNSK